MSLLETKIVLLVVTLAVGWIGGSLPLLWDRQPFRGRWIGGGNAFAAGLFLAIGMLHLLPDSAVAFRAHGVDYPAASLLAMVAFLVMLLLEHVLSPEAAHSAAHAHSGAGLHEPPGHAEMHRHVHGARSEASSRAISRPYVLVLALSVHSVLAGLGLGTQTDSAGAGLTFAAIAIHKATAGLALGIALLTTAIPKRTQRGLVALFAAMTPLGIGIGLLAGTFLGSGLFAAWTTALAGGTFLYIGAFDLLQDEFLHPGRRWSKWLCAALGVALAAILGGVG